MGVVASSGLVTRTWGADAPGEIRSRRGRRPGALHVVGGVQLFLGQELP